ncbi:hypothetical protein O181_065683 [Austropuccinia psidii MF-1]|uniref:Uncharacterized protein n=1 Tax=Austropuccinia psidii MF-1 TaxID=1389203 RepID=A0A9Q3I2V1_9BASI|nr:hypothetical protein [Austropuccinia psidii MF-1]
MPKFYVKFNPSTFSKPNVKRRLRQPQFICQHYYQFKIFFSRSKYLWNPSVQSVSTASTGFYLILVLRSSPFKVGGYCHNHEFDPPVDGCGNPTWSQVGANWSSHIIYGQSAPLGVLWLLRHNPFRWPFMASGHILPSLVFLANFHLTNPQAFTLDFGHGGPFVF